MFPGQLGGFASPITDFTRRFHEAARGRDRAPGLKFADDASETEMDMRHLGTVWTLDRHHDGIIEAGDIEAFASYRERIRGIFEVQFEFEELLRTECVASMLAAVIV